MNEYLPFIVAVLGALGLRELIVFYARRRATNQDRADEIHEASQPVIFGRLLGRIEQLEKRIDALTDQQMALIKQNVALDFENKSLHEEVRELTIRNTELEVKVRELQETVTRLTEQLRGNDD